MEAWGIIMMAFTLFAMLVLTVAHVSIESSDVSFDLKHDTPEKERVGELKKAA